LDRLILPLNLTRGERADLVAFLNALTGQLLDIKEPELPK
jgi:hypothetical protein